MKMIIMAGGSGSRLWPLSRTKYPKQFLKLHGMEKSIFQMTIERCLLMGSINDLYIVTSKDYLHLIQGQLEELEQHLPAEQILLEPQAKNTLPAIMFAVQAIRKKGEDICAVFASDHVIDHPQRLAGTVLGAAELASKGFVCFAITPTGPETGFGYMKPGKDVPGGFEVAEFKEKPDYETAKLYVRDGYLWNSGMFLFHSGQFDDAVKKYNPEVYEAFQEDDINEKFKRTPAISVDYGLTEKMKQVYGVRLAMEWTDIGSFAAFFDKYHTKRDECGNIYFNEEIMLESKSNLVYSEGEKAVAIIGVSDIVVVEQEDALLICSREQTAKVKDAVDILRKRKDPRADEHFTGQGQ